LAVIVGPKGQIVINKEIRDRLGIQPRWIALQRIVGDHVEVYFLPPEHNKSLLGCLEKQTRVHLKTEAELNKAREKAWEIAAAETFGTGKEKS
jgi:bifunctional DNA-binding transcriptional regulator/antitoxin component of YhaV-PrlF toxin-antitoxin module